VRFFCQFCLSSCACDYGGKIIGKLRKLWDSLSELHSSLFERRMKGTGLRPKLLPVKTTQFTQIFPSRMTSHKKSLGLNESV
jgi:hypothetical protein